MSSSSWSDEVRHSLLEAARFEELDEVQIDGWVAAIGIALYREWDPKVEVLGSIAPTLLEELRTHCETIKQRVPFEGDIVSGPFDPAIERLRSATSGEIGNLRQALGQGGTRLTLVVVALEAIVAPDCDLFSCPTTDLRLRHGVANLLRWLHAGRRAILLTVQHDHVPPGSDDSWSQQIFDRLGITTVANRIRQCDSIAAKIELCKQSGPDIILVESDGPTITRALGNGLKVIHLIETEAAPDQVENWEALANEKGGRYAWCESWSEVGGDIARWSEPRLTEPSE